MSYFIIGGLMLCGCGMVFFPTLSGHKTAKLDKQLYIAFSIVLIIFAALRNNVGLDFGSYRDNYELIHSSNVSILSLPFGFNNMEPLFQFVNYFSPSFRFFVIACVGLGVLSKIVFFYRNFNAKLFCLFLYFCSVYLYYDFGIVRQGIAISIIWYSFKYIKKKKFLKFLVGIIIASLFHITALICLPIYFLGNKEYSGKFYVLLLILSFIVMSLFEPVMILLSKLNLGFISYKLTAYTTYLSSSESIIVPVLKRLVVFVICFECLKYFGRSGSRYAKNSQWLYINAYYLSIVEMIAFAPIFVISTRGTASLYYLYIPMFSIIITNTRIPKKIRLLLFVMMVALSINSLVGILFESSDATYIPYKIG